MAKSKYQDRVCLGCGKRESRPARSKPVFFCDKNCKLLYRRKQWREENPLPGPKACSICGSQFLPSPYIYYKAKYCSQKCKSKGYRNRVTEFFVRNPNKKSEYHFQQRKKKKWGGNWWAALTRDKFTCQLCGLVDEYAKPKSSRLVLIHHLDGEGETGGNNHALDNLMTLCYDCHEGMHGISIAYLDGRWQFVGKVLQRFRFEPPVIEKSDS